MNHIKIIDCNEVDTTQIVNMKAARLTLQEKAGVKKSVFYESTRHYNAGKIIEYDLEMETGEIIHRKYNKRDYYNHLCELANCELWDIDDNGKHIGYIVKEVME